MKTEEILDLLKLKHPPDKYGFFEELRIGTGYGKDSEQRLDAWAIHYHPSKRNVTTCYEVKASRSDFLSEIKKPLKRRHGLRLANEFYFVAPQDMCKIEEVPVECGLIEVVGSKLVTKIKAPHRDVMPPTWLFLASICRRQDRSRLEFYKELLKEDGTLQEYGNASLRVLIDHIDKWKNYNMGNKEVPDMFARELEKIFHEILEEIKANRQVRQ